MNAAATAGNAPPPERDIIAARAADAFAVSRDAKAKLGALRRRPARVSTIEKDPEVAAFLRERFRTRTTLAQLRAACVDRFGEDRAPSAGRIDVFRQRVRT